MKRALALLLLAAACGGGSDRPRPPASESPDAAKLRAVWEELVDCAVKRGLVVDGKTLRMPAISWRNPIQGPETARCCLPSANPAVQPCGATGRLQPTFREHAVVRTCTAADGRPLERREAFWWHENKHVILFQVAGDDDPHHAAPFWRPGVCPVPYSWAWK